MTKKEQTQVWAKTIQKYGVMAQIDMLVEECAELIVAVNHYKRDREHALSDILSEIADVEIMIKQMRLIFHDNEINNLIEYKTRRLKNRLNGGE